MELKNKNITIGELGEERKFVSGTKNWRIDFAELNGNRFEKGVKVKFDDLDDDEEYIGLVNWIIVTEQGDVEVSFDAPLGRVDLEDLEIVTS